MWQKAGGFQTAHASSRAHSHAISMTEGPITISTGQKGPGTPCDQPNCRGSLEWQVGLDHVLWCPKCGHYTATPGSLTMS
eukprot:g45112.t1